MGQTVATYLRSKSLFQHIWPIDNIHQPPKGQKWPTNPQINHYINDEFVDTTHIQNIWKITIYRPMAHWTQTMHHMFVWIQDAPNHIHNIQDICEVDQA